MNTQRPLWRAWAIALPVALALFVTIDANAATATPNVTNASTSQPKLNLAGNAWEPFGNALGYPNASKSIKVLYVADDTAVYPLNAAGAAVQLRPKTAGPTINCTFNAAIPILTASNGGTCTFRIINTAGQVDTLEVFHLGLLSGNVRLTATGIAASGVGNTVDAYDSDLVLPGTPPVPAAGPPLSRKPARLVLVFDKSGSMDWTTKHDDPACGPYYTPVPDCRRWNVLRRAAAQMISVGKAYQLPTDQLGVVFFDNDAAAVGAGLGAMTNATLDAVLTEIDSRSPGGGTSIGDGVENLHPALVGADNANFNNAMLVFTDGAQNTSKFLAWDGSHLLFNTTNTPIGGTRVIADGKQLKLCPFRLRIDDPADMSSSMLLNNMASESACPAQMLPSTINNPPSNVVEYFLSVLNSTLIGDKLELLHVSSGQQTAPASGAVSSQAMAFKTSKQDLAFTVLLSWDRAFQNEGRPKITLSKDGVTFEPRKGAPFLINGGQDHIAMTLRAPFCNAASKCVSSDGDWKLDVTPTTLNGTGHWNLFVVGDNGSIASSYSIVQATPGVGEALKLKAMFTEGGKPLIGLPAGTVRAFISGPSQSLGNVLSAGKAKPGESPQSDLLSAAGLKVQAMLADPAQRDKLLAALELGAEQGIPLTETSPGEYAGEFPATLAEGVYHVVFRTDSTSPDNGGFTRVHSTDFYVPVQPDNAATAATLTQTAASTCPPIYRGGCVQITLRPVDAKGNLLGPGKAAGIWTTANQSDIVGSVIDNLDGSYSLVVGHKKSGAKLPVLSIGGASLDLSSPGKLTNHNAYSWLYKWWFWLILLVLLAVIIWRWKRA
jgi:hypothetical protein